LKEGLFPAIQKLAMFVLILLFSSIKDIKKGNILADKKNTTTCFTVDTSKRNGCCRNAFRDKAVAGTIREWNYEPQKRPNR
jgi:hypothetical protein